MFYLTTCSTHFVYSGKGHMVKDHSDSERGNQLPLLQWFFHIHLPTYRTAHTMVFGTAVVEQVFYLTTHSTHFIYGYMASDIW